MSGGLRGTPFHESTAARVASTWWYGWGGYAVPDVYTDLHAELTAIRTAVSMNEMSPIPKIAVVGPDAAACVDHLLPLDVSKMDVRSAWYAPWCNDDGKVVADGIVFRYADRFVFSGDNSISHFRSVGGSFDVAFEDRTDDHGILALQGPRSRLVLEAATGERWSDLPFSRMRSTEIGGCPVTVARQGFTGELGYELWVDRPDGHRVWEAVADAGATFELQPAGEYAIDVARVEAGLVLVSADYTGAGPDQPSADITTNPADHVSPFELGIGHRVDLDKRAGFVGKAALVSEADSGPSRRTVGLVIDVAAVVDLFLAAGVAPDVSPRVRWDHLPLTVDGEVIGRASSVTWSPTTSQLIGFGLVPVANAEVGSELSVEWADFWGRPLGRAPARVCEYPFIDLRRRA